MKLYIHPASPNARRARLAARLADYPGIQEIEIDMRAGENRSDWYLALNPLGKVPTLVGDSWTLFESHAIATHLAKGTNAMPSDLLSECAQWQFFDTAHFGPVLGRLIFQHLFAPEKDPAKVTAAIAEYRRFAAVIESALVTDYLLGDEPTIADAGLVASLTYAEKCDIPLDETPKLNAWRERVESLPILADTKPPV